MDTIKFNLPVLISEWMVNYKPLPFSGRRTIKHYLGTSLLDRATSFSDFSYEDYKIPKYPRTLPVSTHYDIEKEGYDLLRHHYVYKKKIWSFPDIDMINDYLIYIPYHIIQKDKEYILYEEPSGQQRKLKSNDQLLEMMRRG
ncbi:hypothetical protein [Salinicoccus albus]|uniref:hypothetical protein n=1 Tax=Salinicoccus albus TaxID=418756 RepID=UPI000379EF04|nr:hypothetical protein [Salinicoccus albus]